MSISIQGSAAAQLAMLESLTSQTSQTGTAGGAGATSLLDATTPDAASSVIDVTGGTPATTGVSTGLATSASIADAAVAAGASVEQLLGQMQKDAISASNPTLDSNARASLNADFKSNLAQIQKAIGSAGVDGVNLIDGSVTGSANVSAATLTGVNLTVGGPLISLDANASLSDPSTASAIATSLGNAISNVGQAIGQISAQGQAIESHLSVVARAGLALSPGVTSAVNGGLDGDGARLAALQVQQQLSLSGGSVANQSPNSILALFQAA